MATPGEIKEFQNDEIDMLEGTYGEAFRRLPYVSCSRLHEPRPALSGGALLRLPGVAVGRRVVTGFVRVFERPNGVVPQSFGLNKFEITLTAPRGEEVDEDSLPRATVQFTLPKRYPVSDM